MSLCKNGQIQNCCHPNALITLKEYLVDYASETTRDLGNKVIDKELLSIPDERIRNATQEYLEKILNGERDFRF